MDDREEIPQLFEPFAVQEIPLDGFFSDARIEGDTFRCTAFSLQSMPGRALQGQPVAVVRLIMSTRATRRFIEQAVAILSASKAKSRLSRNQRRRLG